MRHVLDEHKHFLLGCYAGPTQHYLKQSLHHHHEMEHSTVHYPGASPMETSLSIAQNGIVKRSMQPISEETMFQAMQQIHEKEKLLLQLQWDLYRREEQWMFASTTKDTCISLAPQLVHPPARTQDHAKETTILGDSQKSQEDSGNDNLKMPKIKVVPHQKKKCRNTKWKQSYTELLTYKKEYGHCIVPRGFDFNPRLAVWVAEQRKQYKLHIDGRPSSITQERIEMLDQVDFVWNAQEAAWDRHIADLKNFKNECGDCLVPIHHSKYPKLGLWVKEQRRHYNFLKRGKPSHMTFDRFDELDTLEFCWDTQDAIWGERLRELKDFKSKYGHVLVPKHCASSAQLGTWVHHQRQQFRSYERGKPCHITPMRIAALDAIGFIWKPREKNSLAENMTDGSKVEENLNCKNVD